MPTVLCRVCICSDDVGHRQIRSILHIKSHSMVLSLPDVLVWKLGVSICLLLAREPCPLHHLEEVCALSRRLRGSSAEDSSELLAVLQCQGCIGALVRILMSASAA